MKIIPGRSGERLVFKNGERRRLTEATELSILAEAEAEQEALADQAARQQMSASLLRACPRCHSRTVQVYRPDERGLEVEASCADCGEIWWPQSLARTDRTGRSDRDAASGVADSLAGVRSERGGG